MLVALPGDAMTLPAVLTLNASKLPTESESVSPKSTLDMMRMADPALRTGRNLAHSRRLEGLALQQDVRAQDASAIAWERIEQFVGYGRPDAPVIFLGMEEGADNARLVPDLLGRSLTGPYGEISREGPTQRTWSRMCELMLRREGVARPTGEERLAYQRARLGKLNGDTLVAELMPYPCQDAVGWPEIYRSRFATRSEYLATMGPRRQAMLREILSSSPRELIVCYGKTHWPYYRAIFGVEPQSTGRPFEICKWGSARVVLAPHFVSRAFNSNAQMEAFAAEVLAEPSKKRAV